jgi:hypothetical protein
LMASSVIAWCDLPNPPKRVLALVGAKARAG